MKKNEDGQPPKDENQIIAERRAKLAELRAAGAPFPNDFRREHLAGDLHHAYDALSKEELEAKGVTFQGETFEVLSATWPASRIPTATR